MAIRDSSVDGFGASFSRMKRAFPRSVWFYYLRLGTQRQQKEGGLRTETRRAGAFNPKRERGGHVHDGWSRCCGKCERCVTSCRAPRRRCPRPQQSWTRWGHPRNGARPFSASCATFLPRLRLKLYLACSVSIGQRRRSGTSTTVQMFPRLTMLTMFHAI